MRPAETRERHPEEEAAATAVPGATDTKAAAAGAADTVCPVTAVRGVPTLSWPGLRPEARQVNTAETAAWSFITPGSRWFE